MSVREYIGARYVPLFIGEWSSSVAYEPLSIVTYQGDSYTSRQAVPIGAQITDTRYWALTGAFNAQVEQYRNEVRSLAAMLPETEFSSTETVKDYVDSFVHVLSGKTAVVYGDSTAVVHGGYFDGLEDVLGMTVTNRAISGTRVTPTSDTPDSTKNDLWNIVKSADANTFDFDYLFLCYGTNEWQDSTEPFDSAGTGSRMLAFEPCLADCIDTILGLNPDIQIVYVAPAYAYRNTWGQSLPNFNTRGFKLEVYSEIAKRVMKRYGMRFVDLAHLGINDLNYSSYMDNSSGVYVHYKEAFLPVISDYLAYSFPWNTDLECCQTSIVEELLFDSLQNLSGAMSGLDASQLMTNDHCYVGSNFISMDYNSEHNATLKSVNDVNFKNGVYVNFLSGSQFKLYPEEHPSDFVIVTPAWGRVSAYIKSDCVCKLVIERLSSSDYAVSACDFVISDTPYGFIAKRSSKNIYASSSQTNSAITLGEKISSGEVNYTFVDGLMFFQGKFTVGNAISANGLNLLYSLSDSRLRPLDGQIHFDGHASRTGMTTGFAAKICGSYNGGQVIFTSSDALEVGDVIHISGFIVHNIQNRTIYQS